jgi:hypothetical protein
MMAASLVLLGTWPVIRAVLEFARDRVVASCAWHLGKLTSRPRRVFVSGVTAL